MPLNCQLIGSYHFASLSCPCGRLYQLISKFSNRFAYLSNSYFVVEHNSFIHFGFKFFYLVEDFCIYFNTTIILKFTSLTVHLFGLGIRVILALHNEKILGMAFRRTCNSYDMMTKLNFFLWLRNFIFYSLSWLQNLAKLTESFHISLPTQSFPNYQLDTKNGTFVTNWTHVKNYFIYPFPTMKYVELCGRQYLFIHDLYFISRSWVVIVVKVIEIIEQSLFITFLWLFYKILVSRSHDHISLYLSYIWHCRGLSTM